MIKITILPPAEQDVFFQEVQFDPDLRRAYMPEGTSHIDRQGSRTNDQPEGKSEEEGLNLDE